MQTNNIMQINNIELASSLADKNTLTGVKTSITFDICFPFIVGLKAVINDGNELKHWKLDDPAYEPLSATDMKNVIVDTEYKADTGKDRFTLVTSILSPLTSCRNNIYYDNKERFLFIIPDQSTLPVDFLTGTVFNISGCVIGYRERLGNGIVMDLKRTTKIVDIFRFPEGTVFKENVTNESSLVTVYGINSGMNNAALTYVEKAVNSTINGVGYTFNYGVQSNTGDATMAINIGKISDLIESGPVPELIPLSAVARTDNFKFSGMYVGDKKIDNNDIYLYIRM